MRQDMKGRLKIHFQSLKKFCRVLPVVSKRIENMSYIELRGRFLLWKVRYSIHWMIRIEIWRYCLRWRLKMSRCCWNLGLKSCSWNPLLNRSLKLETNMKFIFKIIKMICFDVVYDTKQYAVKFSQSLISVRLKKRINFDNVFSAISQN